MMFALSSALLVLIVVVIYIAISTDYIGRIKDEDLSGVSLNKIVLWSISICLLVIAVTPILLYVVDEIFSIDSEKFDHYGSFIGGLVGSVLSFASIVLILKTLKDQDEDIFNQKVESRFFELVRIHRENVKEMNLKGKTGHSAIIWMMRELFECISIATQLNNEFAPDYSLAWAIEEGDRKLLNCPYTDQEILNFAYTAFFFGCAGKDRAETFKEYVKNYDLIFVDEYIRYCNDFREVHEVEKNFTYKIFSGHQLRLGHYYRNMYQAVNYIDKIDTSKLKYRDKYGYIKTLRAQLTTQEQVLLFFNSISNIGLDWEINKDRENEKLITKYNLIKNIPHKYAAGIDIRGYYPDIHYEGDSITKKRIELEEKYI